MMNDDDVIEEIKDILERKWDTCPIALTDEQKEMLLEDIFVDFVSKEDTSTRGEQSVGICDQDSRLEEYTFTTWAPTNDEDAPLEVEGKVLMAIDENMPKYLEDKDDESWEAIEWEFEWKIAKKVH